MPPRSASMVWVALVFLFLLGLLPPVEAQSPSKRFITLYLHEYAGGLHIAPETISVTKGTELVINVQNPETNRNVHDLAIPDLGVATGDLSPGSSTTLDFVADRVGVFEYFSTKPGEKEAGMKGTLVVMEPSPPSEAPRTPAFGIASVVGVLGGVALWASRRPRL